MEVPDYFKATNSAYDVLLAHKQNKLPVLVLPLIKNTPNVSAMTYTEFADKMGVEFDDFVECCPSNCGFTLIQENRYIIVANEKLPFEVYRFTLAHEFGHCILRHTEDNLTSQKEANCFARNLLCPHPIRIGLMLQTPHDYSRAFVVSTEMAAITIKLHEMDRYHTIRMMARQVSSNFSETLKFGGEGRNSSICLNHK